MTSDFFNIHSWRDVNYVIGWIALSIYSFFWLIDLDISRAGESVFVLCFVIAWFGEKDRSVKYNKVILLPVAAVGLIILAYPFAAERFPEFADGQVKSGRHFVKLFLCISVAWWIKGSLKAVSYMLGILCVGFLFSLAMNSEPSLWIAGLQGQRVDFGYKNAQHTAVYFGLLLILSLMAIGYVSAKQKSLKALAIFSLLVLSVAGVILTQTRAVWVALVVTGICIVAIALVVYSKKRGLRASRMLFWGGLGGLLAAALASSVAFFPIVQERLSVENDVISAAVKGDLQDTPYTSIGIRLHTWAYAIDKIEERPLMGWGGQSRKPLIDEGPFPDWVKVHFGHFHNSYLEIVLGYGLAGALILALLTAAIIKGIFGLSKEHPYLFLGLLSSFIFFAIVNLFESYLIFRTGMYFYVLIGGIGMSFYLFGFKDNREQAS